MFTKKSLQSGLLTNQRFKTSTDCKDNSEHAADCAGYYSNGYCDTGTILVKFVCYFQLQLVLQS